MPQAGTLKCCDLAAGQQQRMQLAGTPPPVKMRLERSAERDKRE